MTVPARAAWPDAMAGSGLRAVAWDVDGTLVDSEPLHLQALQAVCREHDVDLSDFGPAPFVGVAVTKVWQTLEPRFGCSLGGGSELRESAFLTSIADHYSAGAHELRPMPGALEALRWLRARQVPMCAVSNSPGAIVQANLRAIDAIDCMRFIISLDDVSAPKPHPTPYLEAARLLGLDPVEVWAVEDSPSGVASAHAAGLQVLLVSPHPDARRAMSHVRHHLESLADAPAFWQGTLNRCEGFVHS